MWEPAPVTTLLAQGAEPNPTETVTDVDPVDSAAPVLVAVARDGSDAAVRAGAAEARRTGRPLLLVHVAGADTYAQQLGRDALALATTRSRCLADAAHTSTRMVIGSVLPELAALADGSALLVTERGAPDTMLRPSASVTAALAAATDVPLLSVPSGWVDGPRVGVVVTGIDVAHGQHVSLRMAVVASLLRHATLRVVATTWRPTGSASSELTHVEPRDDRIEREAVARQVEEAGGDLCDVAVEVLAGRAESVLVAASRDAELLVLGRHSPLLRSGSRLGPVARAVLRDAVCPVLLSPPEAAHEPVPRTAR